MDILSMKEADTKAASLKLHLKAKSGYSCSASYPAVSPLQWAAICAICDESENGKALVNQFRHLLALDDAADALLAERERGQ